MKEQDELLKHRLAKSSLGHPAFILAAYAPMIVRAPVTSFNEIHCPISVYGDDMGFYKFEVQRTSLHEIKVKFAEPKKIYRADGSTPLHIDKNDLCLGGFIEFEQIWAIFAPCGPPFDLVKGMLELLKDSDFATDAALLLPRIIKCARDAGRNYPEFAAIEQSLGASR